MAIEDLMTELFASHRKWKEGQEEQARLEEEINRIRNELSAGGVHLTLDDFDERGASMAYAPAVIPALPETVEEEEQLDDEEYPDDFSTPVSNVSAERIRREALVEPESQEDIQRLAGNLVGSFEKAVAAGFGESKNVAPFTEKSDGQVKTRGFNG